MSRWINSARSRSVALCIVSSVSRSGVARLATGLAALHGRGAPVCSALAIAVATCLPASGAVIVCCQWLQLVWVKREHAIIAYHVASNLARAILIAGPFGILIWFSF